MRVSVNTYSSGGKMILYLVRHAQPKPENVDPELSLSHEGISEIEKIAAYTADRKSDPIMKILHSGKTRANQTAEILAKHLSPVNNIEQTDGLKPMDNPAIWQKRLDNINDNIALVGHLPYMANLAELLLRGQGSETNIQFLTATIACLRRDEKRNWSLQWVISPDMLP
jgi:phosphohistidine phosphatase